MKKILKALGVAAIAAAVIPCKVEKDEVTGAKTYQSLLSKLRVGPGADGEGTNISLDALGGVIPTALGHNEADDYADDELDLSTVETEPVFEVSFKVERGVSDEDKAQEETEQAEEAAAQAGDEAEQVREQAEEAAEKTQADAEKPKTDL